MKKNTFPHWVYDGSPIDDPFGHGQDAVDFLHTLKHPASTAPKKAFQLFDPFERITRRIYGPRHANGRRIVKTVFLMLGRGNRKTSHAGAWSLLHLLGPEAEDAGQAIIAAYDRKQAGYGFKEAANIVRMDKRLLAATKIYDAFNSPKQILNVHNGATLQTVSSDGKAQNGSSPSFLLIDEIHAWKNRELWETLDGGTTKVGDPLTIICTTAGRGQKGIGFEKYDYALKVASGEKDDPSFLPILFQIEDGDDWQDETTWPKANPGLPFGFPNVDGLRMIAREAESSPPTRYQFQQYHLNVWQGDSRDPLFDMAVWDRSSDPHFDVSDLEELPCFLGVDLSRNGGDLTAIVGAWRHPDGRVSVHPWFYTKSEGLDEKARVEQLPYGRWRDDGDLTVIEGPTVEPDVIADKIIDLCATFDVREVAFDPTFGGPIMGKLMDQGINVFAVPQSAKNMHGPICDLERTVNGRRIRHNAHPILRQHFDSAVVKRATNAGQLVTMHKGTNHGNHIDGAVAAALAVSRASLSNNSKSLFDLDPEEYEAAMDRARQMAA